MRLTLRNIPGEWATRGVCASEIGPLAWDEMPARDKRQACQRCPVLQECTEWASGHSWADESVAGWTAYGAKAVRFGKGGSTENKERYQRRADS